MIAHRRARRQEDSREVLRLPPYIARRRVSPRRAHSRSIENARHTMTWQVYALLSAVAAGATAILAKIGVQGVPSDLATALRTSVVLVFAWAIVLARGEQHGISDLAPRTLVFLALSGCATGLSWLAYFRALQLGPASRVAPIDKLSLAVTLVLAAVVLREPITWRVAAGVALMIAGALLTLSR
jgi:transporter family protein